MFYLNAMKLKINNSRIFGKFTIMWQLNHNNLNNQFVQEKNHKINYRIL